MAARAQVLSLFRALHKTRRRVFQDDSASLDAVRKMINVEFEKNRQELSPDKITELLKFGSDVELVLRTSVVQAEVMESGALRINPSKEHLEEGPPPAGGIPRCC
ncbi:complex III assembly factor LYRM7 [Lampetra planeri]